MPQYSERYLRPLVQVGPGKAADAYALAGGWGWFRHVEVLSRSVAPVIVPAHELKDAELAPFITPRAAIAGLEMDRPRVMGILNATPDSFSDGGIHAAAEVAITSGIHMIKNGAHILDIGGESTRPGARAVLEATEIARVVPVIKGLRAQGATCPISIDTRKAPVAQTALLAGATVINDVSGFTYDPALAPLAAKYETPVCVMHSRGDPATMQHDPQYDNVLLDVYDFLAAQIYVLTAQGIARSRIIADPGIGFAKTQAHNLALLSRLSLFHGLGVALLLGASRKKFIGTIGGADDPVARMPGSVAVALAGLAQGVQILRVHDVGPTVQAIALWRASVEGMSDE